MLTLILKYVFYRGILWFMIIAERIIVVFKLQAEGSPHFFPDANKSVKTADWS